jgi:hypothetical protein
MVAGEYLDRAYEMAPEIAEVAIHYWALLKQHGNETRAAELWAEIAKRHPNHPAVKAN